MKRALAAAACSLLAFACEAAEWVIEPSVESRASNTDNINLTPNVHENVPALSVSPRVTFARRTEATDIAGTASLGFNRYPGNSELDADDAGLSLTSQWRNERSSYGVAAAYIRDSTLQTELATTGIVQARRQRDLVTLSPSWSYSLTLRSSIFAQYQYGQSKYESGAGLSDNSSQQVSGGYRYLVSERTSATVSGSYSRYETDDGSLLTRANSLSAAISHSLAERLTVGLGIGVRRSGTTITSTALLCEFGALAICDFFGIPLQSVTATSRISDSGLSYNASADYNWEQTSANLSLSRDINPTASGPVVETDRFALGGSHQFSEKLSGDARGAYLVSRYVGGLGSDTEYFSLNASLSRRLDEWWSAGAGYSFAHQKVKNAPDSASANTVYLSISYNWPRISISR